MKVIVCDTLEQIGHYAAELLIELISTSQLTNLGVATGSSPLPVYRALSAYPSVTFSKLELFALDEYVGIEATHTRSYHHVVMTEVANPLDIPREKVHVPDGNPKRLETAGERYEAAIATAGGVDMQILGIGATGHIGFNEPGSSLRSRTRVWP